VSHKVAFSEIDDVFRNVHDRNNRENNCPEVKRSMVLTASMSALPTLPSNPHGARKPHITNSLELGSTAAAVSLTITHARSVFS
jgi:hypothetical protein